MHAVRYRPIIRFHWPGVFNVNQLHLELNTYTQEPEKILEWVDKTGKKQKQKVEWNRHDMTRPRVERELTSHTLCLRRADAGREPQADHLVQLVLE
jgi:DUF438 domain-containing protein